MINNITIVSPQNIVNPFVYQHIIELNIKCFITMSFTLHSYVTIAITI